MPNFFSLNPLSRLGVGAQNALRGALGAPPFDTSALRFDIPDGQAAARIREAVRALARSVSYPFGYRLRTRWAASGKGGGALGLASGGASTLSDEAILASLALRYYDPALAREIAHPFFANQTIEGMIPNAVSPMSISTRPADPLLLMAATRRHVISPDIENLKYCFNRTLKFSDWLAVRRKRDDGFFYPAGADDLHFFAAFASGLKPGDALADTVHVGLNCLHIILYHELARAAVLLGSPKEARKFHARARKLSRLLLDSAWDPERRDLFDSVAGKRADAPCPVGFLALPAEVVTREQAGEIIERAKKTPRLLSPRTPAHAIMLLFFLNGMENYGFAAEAGALAHEALREITSGDPADNRFIAAAALPLLLERILGCHPFHDRLVLAPRIPIEWKDRPITIDDAAARRTVTLTLLENNRVRCHIRAEGREDIAAEVENHKFRNFIFRGEEKKKIFLDAEDAEKYEKP